MLVIEHIRYLNYTVLGRRSRGLDISRCLSLSYLPILGFICLLRPHTVHDARNVSRRASDKTVIPLWENFDVVESKAD